MTFNSVAFALFLPVTFAVYWSVRPTWRPSVIVIASYVFYGAWDQRFLALLLISTVADYSVALGLSRSVAVRRRRALLGVSLTVNLGILALFKYSGFFLDGAVDLLELAGLQANPSTLQLVLPVGISFYTFQTLGYTIDVYRGRLEPCRDPVLFAGFVAYFPQLVAGPIERASKLLPQLARAKPFPPARQLQSGVQLILWGLVKKVVIADQMASLSDDVFASPSTAGSKAAILGSLAFMVQIYADFSGYTDIARGTSRLFSIELVRNFTQPYLSRSIAEFWQRWHISLANWMRDYVFLPQLKRPITTTKVSVAYVTTFALLGLWHGARWSFVVWGVVNGALLALHRIRGARVPRGEALPGVRDVGAITRTLAVLFILTPMFRSSSLSDYHAWALALFETSDSRVAAWSTETVLIGFGSMLLIDVLERRRATTERRPDRIVRNGVFAGLAIVAITMMSGGTGDTFIYFQF